VNATAVKTSTHIYRQEKREPQYRHRERYQSWLRIGTMSGSMRSRWLQLGQWDGGSASDSPRGSRQMQTFRKLPTMAPKTKLVNAQ
jgi:hypothetical protein